MIVSVLTETTGSEVTDVVKNINWKEMIELAKHQFENLLNPSALTLDSVEGVVVLLLILFVIKGIFEKSIKLLSWCLSGILIIQLGYILSLTDLNNHIAFDTLFKYDILSSLAQLCVGTKLCDVILYVNAFLTTIFTKLGNMLSDFVVPVTNFFKTMTDMTIDAQ